MSRWEYCFVKTSNGANIHTKLQRHGPRFNGKLAFIAHAFGRLGGSWSEHVVQALAANLTDNHGYHVVLMNSRGVGESTGRPSFTLISETQDYESVVQYYVDKLTEPDLRLERLDLLLCGNSAGTLSASTASIPQSSGTQVRIGYILISYPLSATWALSLFRQAFHEKAMRAIASNETLRLLTIRGTNDQFTADSKYAKWEKELMTASSNGSVACAICEGVGHFWLEVEHLARLLAEVDNWLSTDHISLRAT